MALLLACAVQAQAQKTLPRRSRDSIAHTLSRMLDREVKGAATRVAASAVKGRKVEIRMSEAMGYYPFRPESVEAIYDSVRAALPYSLQGHEIAVYVSGRRIEELIPQAFRPHDRSPRFTYDNRTPLVRRTGALVTPRRGLAGRHIALWHSHGRYFDQREGVWRWQRIPVWQTCEDVLTRSFVLQYLAPMLENAGAYVMMPHERDMRPEEIIADNDPGIDSGGSYSETAGDMQWRDAGTGFAHLHEFYTSENPFTEGTARSVQTTTGGAESRAVWSADIPRTGDYAVYVSYKTVKNSTDDARYTVRHAGGETEFVVNQTMGGGTWVYLGTFRFDAGLNDEAVSLSNASARKGRTVTADAVKIGGGTGNVARALSDSLRLPGVEYWAETSGNLRAAEGARYWLQWAGFPEQVYSKFAGGDDYKDDYTSRAHWVNALAGGSEMRPKKEGLRIPVDMALAFHTDAGVRDGETVGTLGIYSTSESRGRFAGGVDRYRSRDLTDIVMTQIVGDMRATVSPAWNRRGMWNKRYYEARIPDVPTMLLELLSHQNFEDMRLASDPEARFIVCRAIYKGILRYLASQYGTPYVVQPLPVADFSATPDESGNSATLRWSPRTDPLEETAAPDFYILYTRVDGGAFDAGRTVESTECRVEIEPGRQYDFRITAANDGGESFPSETLSAAIVPAAKGRMLAINGFDRVSPPYIEATDSLAGFRNSFDSGAAYICDASYLGAQREYRRSQAGARDEGAQLGASDCDMQATLVAGNTFDYPSRHCAAALAAGYTFGSASHGAVGHGEVSPAGYDVVDVILGKQRTTAPRHDGEAPRFRAFGPALQAVLREYAAGGGSLLISGCYAVSDLLDDAYSTVDDRRFAAEVLHCRAAVPYSGRNTVKSAVSKAGFSRGEYVYLTAASEDNYAIESVDSPSPADRQSFVVMRYAANNRPAAVGYEGECRTLVFGFPIEAAGDESLARIMKESLKFLHE